MPYRSKPKPFFAKRDPSDRPSVLHKMPFADSVGGGPDRKRRRQAKKALKILGVLAIFLAIAGLLTAAIAVAWVSRDLPSPDRLLTREVQKSTKIWDRTGKELLYEIHGAQKRTLVGLDRIAPIAVQATLASEDKRFYEHKGVQLKSFIRAMAAAVMKGKRLEGTSTLTQQLIKNAILTNERSLTRKVKELILAYQIERKFSKEEILQMYFNEIPYGSTAYGIETAAQTYFGKSAADLDAAEAALLAALPKAPSRLSPYGSNKEELLWWQKFILDEMVKTGALTQEQADEAKAIDILARVKPRRDAIEAPHFVLHVKELLAEKYGEREVEAGGLNVVTTLDFKKQEAAEKAVTDGMEAVKTYGGSNAALVAVDPKTGHVLAMVGSADYFDAENDGNVNVALRNRQPGSSFKPIVYGAAFEKGYTPDTVVFDANTTFPTDTGTPYEPKNYDLSEHGPVTFRKALAGSLNIPAVKALYLVGVDKAIDMAEAVGYTTLGDRSRFGLSLVLGGAEVKPVEHAAAFAAFASEGAYRAPAYILKVEDAQGNVLEEWKDAPKEGVMKVETARNINAVLSDNAARAYIFGEKNYLTLPDRPVAAKTGTTNGFHDAWTVGYTPSLSTAVWVGNNDNAAMKSKADGSRVAAPIWQAFMKAAHEGAEVEAFAAPEPIVTGKPVLDGHAGEIVVKIDRFSGLLATAETPPGAIEERTYRQAHDILHYIDKDDPLGPYPADAHEDPQYLAWETAVADWATRNGWETTGEPPTEISTTHDPLMAPTVMFATPDDNAVVPERTFLARVAVSAPRGVTRVEYAIDGVTVGTATSFPWEGYLTVPGIFGKGFYTLRATAFDDIENAASQDITINVQTDGSPLKLSWTRPSGNATYRIRDFPIYIDTALSDRLGIASVDILAKLKEGEEIPIGTLKTPKTNGVSVTWDTAPDPGAYELSARATLTNGDVRTLEGPTITIKP